MRPQPSELSFHSTLPCDAGRGGEQSEVTDTGTDSEILAQGHKTCLLRIWTQSLRGGGGSFNYTNFSLYSLVLEIWVHWVFKGLVPTRPTTKRRQKEIRQHYSTSISAVRRTEKSFGWRKKLDFGGLGGKLLINNTITPQPPSCTKHQHDHTITVPAHPSYHGTF